MPEVRNVERREVDFRPSVITSGFLDVNLPQFPSTKRTWITEECEFFGLTFTRSYYEDLEPATWSHEFPGENEPTLSYYEPDRSWDLDFDNGAFHSPDNERAFTEWLMRKLEGP